MELTFLQPRDNYLHVRVYLDSLAYENVKEQYSYGVRFTTFKAPIPALVEMNI